MNSERYLHISAAAGVLGKPASWVKKRVISGMMQGRFEDEVWWVSLDSLERLHGPIDVEGLGPVTMQNPIVYNFLPPLEKSKTLRRETENLNAKAAKPKAVTEAQATRENQRQATRRAARIAALERRRSNLEPKLKRYISKRRRTEQEGRVPHTNQHQRMLLHEFKAVRDELRYLHAGGDPNTYPPPSSAKSPPSQKVRKGGQKGGIEGYYVPGRLNRKRYWGNEEDIEPAG